MRVVAFCGPKFSGKDSAAKALFQQNAKAGTNGAYFRKAQMAEGVKKTCNDFFGYSFEDMEDGAFKETKTPDWPHIEPRWPMMDIANWLRDKYGGDIHARRWERQAKLADGPTVCHVVPDHRFPEELTMFKRLGALVLYIQRDEAEETLADKLMKGDLMAANQSEGHYALLKREASYIVENNGPLYDLHNQVLTLVRNHFGFWGYWGLEEQTNA